MNCATCLGACCEGLDAVPEPFDADTRRWLAFHDANGRCGQLTARGRCAIYEDRPKVCQVYQTGALACLVTVRTRRSAAEYSRIRSTGDPRTVHGWLGLMGIAIGAALHKFSRWPFRPRPADD